MEILKYIFYIVLSIGLFIWAGCNMDIASSDSSSVKYQMNNYRHVVIIDKHHDWDLLSDDWYISVKYDGTVRVIEVTKEIYMSYQINDRVCMDVLTGKQI